MRENNTLIKKTLNDGLKKIIALDPNAKKQLKPYAGKTIELIIQPIKKSIFIEIQHEQLLLSRSCHKKPDTCISGTPTALFTMGTGQHIQGLGAVSINGDAGVGQFIAKWLKSFNPDWEEALCLLLGDGPGYRLSQIIGSGIQHFKNLRESFTHSSIDYLQEESRELVRPNEMEEWLDQIDEIKSRTDMLQQKIEQHISG